MNEDLKDKQLNLSDEQLDIIKKYEIIVLYSKQISRTQISKKLNMHKYAVSRIIDRFLAFNNVLFMDDSNKGRNQIRTSLSNFGTILILRLEYGVQFQKKERLFSFL